MGEVGCARSDCLQLPLLWLRLAWGVWAASDTSARVSPSMAQRIEPLQLMINAQGLATAEFDDYTFVFH
jgi:hypothetical protein